MAAKSPLGPKTRLRNLSLAGAKNFNFSLSLAISLGIQFVAVPDILKCFFQIAVEQAKPKCHAPYRRAATTTTAPGANDRNKSNNPSKSTLPKKKKQNTKNTKKNDVLG